MSKGAARFEAEHLAILDGQDVGALRELLGESTRFIALRLVLDEVDKRISEMRRR